MAHIVLQRMLKRELHLPATSLERYFRPALKLALHDAQILEAERCEAYGQIGSPRVAELKAQRNKLEWDARKAEKELAE